MGERALPPKDIADQLQVCLEQVLDQGVPVEDVLRAYPQTAAELRAPLEAALWMQNHRQSLASRPGFAAASRARVVNRIVEMEQAALEPGGFSAIAHRLANLWRAIWPQTPQRQRLFVFQALLVFVLLFTMVTGGTGVAHAAQESIPGDRLYPVKTGLESTALAFSLSAAGDVRLHTMFSQRRLVEIQSLVLENRFEFIAVTVDRFAHHVDQAVMLLEKVAQRNAAQARQLALGLEETLLRQRTVLEVLSQVVPDGIAAEIRRALDVADHSLPAVTEVLEVVGRQEPPVPGSVLTSTPTLFPTATLPISIQLTGTPTPSATVTMTPASTVTQTLAITATRTPTATQLLTASPTSTVVLLKVSTNTPTPPPDDDGGRPTKKPSKTPKPTKTLKPKD